MTNPVLQLSDGRTAPTHPLHVLGYGDSGAKKSTFFATFAALYQYTQLPMLVFQWDPWGKERPYIRQGREGQQYQDEFGTPVTPVFHKTKDEVTILIEHYLDSPDRIYQPDAYDRYRQRMKRFDQGREWERYHTIGWDSATYMSMARRKWDQYVLNGTTKAGNVQDGKQWYGAATSAMEDEIARRAAILPCNTFVVAHVNDDKQDFDGRAILLPAFGGQQNRKMPCGFSECYHFFSDGVGKDAKYRIQTRKNAMFVAGTQIPAPDGMETDDGYRGLWAEVAE